MTAHQIQLQRAQLAWIDAHVRKPAKARIYAINRPAFSNDLFYD